MQIILSTTPVDTVIQTLTCLILHPFIIVSRCLSVWSFHQFHMTWILFKNRLTRFHVVPLAELTWITTIKSRKTVLFVLYVVDKIVLWVIIKLILKVLRLPSLHITFWEDKSKVFINEVCICNRHQKTPLFLWWMLTPQLHNPKCFIILLLQ